MSDSPRVIGSFPETPMTGPISSSEIDGLEMLHLDSPRMDARPRLRVEISDSSAQPRGSLQTPLDSPFPLWESSSAFRNYQRQTANQDRSVREDIRHRIANENAPRLWEYEELDNSNRPAPGRIANIHAETQRLWDSARDLESGDFEAYYNNLDRAPHTPVATHVAEVQVQGSEIDHLESRIRENEAQSIDPPLPPLTDMSISAQRLRIYGDLTDRLTLIEEMGTRLVPDPENPGSVMLTREHNPEYRRISTEVSELYNRFRDLDDLEDRVRDATPAPTANATAFLEDLPVVPVHELTADEKDCNICQEAYGTGCESDVVRLPCNHLFGRQCISTWLTQDDAGLANNTCPMCRAVCFDVTDQRRPHIFLPIGDIVDQFDAAIANDEDDDIADYDGGDSSYFVDVDDEDIREPIPLEWRGAFRFLRDIDHIDFLLSREERHPGQEPISFLESHNGAIDARYMRPAGTQWAGERSFAEQLLALFRLFIGRTGPSEGRDAVVAAALTTLMGRLYQSLQVRMRVADCPVVWRENGPPVSFLIDPAAIPLVELALERLVVVESGGRERHSMAVQSGDDEDGDLHAYSSGFDRIVAARRDS